jgi:hypothetical protein
MLLPEQSAFRSRHRQPDYLSADDDRLATQRMPSVMNLTANGIGGIVSWSCT